MSEGPSTPTWHAYLRWAMAATALLVLAVAGVNILVDPLAVFASPRVPGLNAIKPHLDHHRELVRWKAAQRLCANAAIFGNSRAEIGLDPEAAMLVEQGLVAYNHAIPGTGAGVSLQQLGWLEGAGCTPKTIFMGVEFFDYLGASRARSEQRDATAPPRLDAAFYAESVFSIMGLRDSLATLLLQRARYPATLTDRGFNPLLNYIGDVQQSGHYVLFRQRAEENARVWARKVPIVRPVDGGVSEDEQALDGILVRARRSGSEVHLIIYPYHAQIRLIIERLGLGAPFAEWKKLILDVATRHAKLGTRVKVWDFSGLTPATLEDIPPRGDRSPMRFYWEGGHFKKSLGDLMFARMLGRQENFGVELRPDTAASWVADDRAQVQALLASDSPLRRGVDDLLGGGSNR